jgi:hypothetical protein
MGYVNLLYINHVVYGITGILLLIGLIGLGVIGEEDLKKIKTSTNVLQWISAVIYYTNMGLVLFMSSMPVLSILMVFNAGLAIYLTWKAHKMKKEFDKQQTGLE